MLGAGGAELSRHHASPTNLSIRGSAGKSHIHKTVTATADTVAVMSEGRKRVSERFGVVLEPEVQALGPVAFPPDWDQDRS